MKHPTRWWQRASSTTRWAQTFRSAEAFTQWRRGQVAAVSWMTFAASDHSACGLEEVKPGPSGPRMNLSEPWVWVRSRGISSRLAPSSGAQGARGSASGDPGSVPFDTLRDRGKVPVAVGDPEDRGSTSSRTSGCEDPRRSVEPSTCSRTRGDRGSAYPRGSGGGARKGRGAVWRGPSTSSGTSRAQGPAPGRCSVRLGSSAMCPGVRGVTVGMRVQCRSMSSGISGDVRVGVGIRVDSAPRQDQGPTVMYIRWLHRRGKGP